jgi:hypothetical protein
MLIKRSSKYLPSGEFWHAGRRVVISRIYGGVSFAGIAKFAVLIGEEQFFNETHYFVLAEGETERDESLVDVIDLCRKFDAEFRNQRWFGRLDANVKEVLAICNRQSYNTGVRNLLVTDVPRIGEWIDEQVAIVHLLVRPQEKRLHFFSESMIPSELQSLPTKDIRAEDYPRATALANVVAGILRCSAENVTAGDLAPDPEPMY